MPDWVYIIGGLAFFAVTYYLSMRKFNNPDEAEKEQTTKDELEEDDYEVK